MELPPRDTDRAPSRHAKRAITRAVALERQGGSVEPPAVELDDQALRAPDAVAFEPPTVCEDMAVPLRCRKPCGFRPREEPLFQPFTRYASVALQHRS